MTVPIDSRVPSKLKAKIWSNEYFDFAQLFSTSPPEHRFQLSLTNNTDGTGSNVPSLCLEPANKLKPIVTIDAWTNAFQIFVGVYTSKFPNETCQHL